MDDANFNRRQTIRVGASVAYAHPGHHASRGVLAAKLGEGRLSFAGEACHARFAGTLAGAWLSGEAAAG